MIRFIRHCPALLILTAIVVACAADKTAAPILADDAAPPGIEEQQENDGENLDPEDPLDLPPYFTLEKLGNFPIDSTAVTEEIAITPGQQTGQIILRATSVPSSAIRCFQLFSARTTTGTYLVEPPSSRADYGPFCVSCSNRAYAGRDFGLFILPNNGADLPENEQLLIRFQARDCLTGLAATIAEDAPEAFISVELLQTDQISPQAESEISLSFVFTQASQFHGLTDVAEDDVLAESLQLLKETFAPLSLKINIAGLYSIEASDPYTINYGPDDFSELDELFGLAVGQIEQATGQSFQKTIPVIFGGCLIYENTLLQRIEQPYGFVTRIPGGFSTGSFADAIFLRGGNCDQGVTVDFWFGPLLSRILSHELGHYLGLYHTIEKDGVADHLDDTAIDNLMYYDPLLESSTGFSEKQIKVIRSHPYTQIN
jgi:hypothetical protein